jgi:VanZ family protein
MFGMLVFLVNYAYGFRSFKLTIIRIPIGTLPVMVFSVLEELSQFFFPARTPEIDDVVFSILGIIFFSLISLVFFGKNSVTGHPVEKITSEKG